MPMYFMRRLHKDVVEGSIAFLNVSLTIPMYFSEDTLVHTIFFFVPVSATTSYMCWSCSYLTPGLVDIIDWALWILLKVAKVRGDVFTYI